MNITLFSTCFWVYKHTFSYTYWIIFKSLMSDTTVCFCVVCLSFSSLPLSTTSTLPGSGVDRNRGFHATLACSWLARTIPAWSWRTPYNPRPVSTLPESEVWDSSPCLTLDLDFLENGTWKTQIKNIIVKQLCTIARNNANAF